MLGGIIHFSKDHKTILLANSADPDQTSHDAVSGLDLNCLPMPHKEVDGLVWVNYEHSDQRLKEVSPALVYNYRSGNNQEVPH